jgi:plasmid stability protein
MANLTVRNLPEEVHRALKVRAARHGRSTEAEVREILGAAVSPAGRMRFGDELAALGKAFGGIELEIKRSKKPMRVAKLT